MIAYRLCSKTFSVQSLLLNGVGAASNGQRWNVPGLRAAYCGTTETVCISEIGYYKIISQVDILQHRLLGGKRPTQALIEACMNQTFTLSKLEVSDDLKICDLTDQSILRDALLRHQLPTYTIADYRKSPHQLLENQWTQELGTKICNEGFHGLYAKSARLNLGKCLILFSGRLLPNNVKVVEQKDYSLSAVDSGGRKISLRSSPVRNKILFEDDNNSRGLVDVLEFPI